MANRTGSMEQEGPLTETVADSFNPGTRGQYCRRSRRPRQRAEVADEAEEYDSEKMDPEEELWPDGPNFAQINAWKEEYGDVYVTSVTPSSPHRLAHHNSLRVSATGQGVRAEACWRQGVSG
jgi:hypothetical protein